MFHRELVRPAGYPIHTFTWTEAIAHLDDFCGTNFRAMRDFVAAIAGSAYSRFLFPCSTMDAVLIGRPPDFNSYEPHLRIQYNPRTRQMTFTYFTDPYSYQRWTTNTPINRAFAHFEHLMLRRLRWCRKVS
jgi:hypothetical protein